MSLDQVSLQRAFDERHGPRSPWVQVQGSLSLAYLTPH